MESESEKQESEGLGERGPEDMEREIAGTRSAVESTMGELSERLRPGQMAQDATAYVRETASRGAVEAWESLRVRVRDNPVPVAVVLGGGLVWYLMSGRENGGVGRYAGRGLEWADRLLKRGGVQAPGRLERAAELGRHAASRASEVGAQTAARAGELGTQLAARASDLGGQAAERASEAGHRVREAGAELSAAPTPESKPLHPTSVYAVTKRDQEELFLTVGSAYGIPAVALRYFNVYGPRQALSNPYTGVMAIFSARLLNGRAPLIFEDGLQSRDFVHVSDVVQANLLALASDAAGGRVYNVGTGRATTILQVAEELARQLEVPVAPELPGSFRAGDVRHCIADISRIREELGYEPRVSLEQGMKELLEWLRTQAPEDRVDEATRELAARALAR